MVQPILFELDKPWRKNKKEVMGIKMEIKKLLCDTYLPVTVSKLPVLQQLVSIRAIRNLVVLRPRAAHGVPLDEGARQ